jgi:uncharacterized Zn finger protein
MAETQGGPCCAHLNVRHETITNVDRTNSDAWRCADCGKPFQPIPLTKEEKLELINKHIEKHGIGPIGDGSFKTSKEG